MKSIYAFLLVGFVLTAGVTVAQGFDNKPRVEMAYNDSGGADILIVAVPAMDGYIAADGGAVKHFVVREAAKAEKGFVALPFRPPLTTNS